MTRLFTSFCAFVIATGAFAQAGYRPAPENLLSRSQFADCRFGIFLHWGLYAMLAQGEWAMTNHNLNYREYEKLAGGFYPSKFDADAWAEAFRQAGARYVCFTTRHHDGFSMFRTAQTPYNIVDATPFARDAVKELADACHRRGLRVHFYYSLIDWWREDAPRGRTGLGTGRPAEKEDADAYFDFMKAQLTELLTQYGNVGAIWFDGIWDQDENPGFDWRLGELYGLIHKLQPGCLIINRGNRIRTGRLVYAPHSRPERPGHAAHILHRVCRTGDSGRRTRRTAAGDTAAGAAPDTAESRDNPYSPQTLHLRPQHRQQNRFSAAFRAGQEGGEMGVKCKLGELRGELQRVRLNLAGCKGVDTLHMRINVYAMRGDRIRKNLLAEPVYFSVPASEADKTTTVDLRPYEIFVRGDFLISVENLTHMPAGAKYWIRARLLARTYTRDTSQAPWKMRKAGVGLSVDVLVEPE